MPLDLNDGGQTAAQPDAVSGTPTAQPAPTQPTAATAATGTPAQPQAQQPHPTAAYSHLSSDGQYGWDGKQWQPIGTVTNAPPHPLVQKASVLRDVAQALAGGPTYQTTIDDQTGATTRTAVPLTKGQIGMAIALEAITGALSGLGQHGPNAAGQAAAAGVQQGVQIAQQRQQQQQQEDQQAQQDAQNRWQTTARKAQLYELNQRAILSTQQAERQGMETMKDQIALNADYLSQVQDAGAVSEQHVPQDAIAAGMKSGRYNAATMTAIPDGVATTVDGHPELTFSLVPNTGLKLDLTQDQYDKYAAARVPGFFKANKIPQTGFPVSIFQLARANQQLGAIQMTGADLSEIKDALTKSGDKTTQTLGASVPDVQSLLNDPTNGAVLAGDLLKLQPFISHSNVHGNTLLESLQQMAAPTKPDPRNPKQQVPNTAAPAAQRIVASIGGGDVKRGWSILQAYHDEVTPEPIKNVDDAQSIITDPASTPREVARARQFLALDTSQKAIVARAGAEAREAAKPQPAPASDTPDALGFSPTVTSQKEADQRFRGFKKNLDSLSQSEQSYAQFQQALSDINAGNWTGADSVVALFNAIGLSAAPLAGRGFRVNENTIREHEHARGWEGALQAKLQGVTSGAVITPQQLKDYAGIASQARAQQIISTANEMHAAGINADAALPTGNGRRIDADTAKVFLTLAGNDPNKARQAATAKGWKVQ